MSVIIHVGPPKTGTTSFQSELRRTSSIGTLNAYCPVNFDINNIAAQLLGQKNSAIESMSSIYKEYLESSYNNIILSAENFSDFGYIDINSYNQRSDFFELLRNIFIDEEVILLYTFTNNNYKRMESIIMESIKHGKSFQPESIFEYIKKIPYFSAQKLFDNIIRIFKPSKVEILTLESFSDVFTKTQWLFDLHFSELESIPALNVSPSCGLAYLLHQINTRMIPVYAECAQENLHEYGRSAIQRYMKLNALESKDSSYFDFVHINSRQELFSFIDPKFTEEQNQLVDYINQFSLDIDDYIKNSTK